MVYSSNYDGVHQVFRLLNFRIPALYSYCNIVQSEHCICWIMCSFWRFVSPRTKFAFKRFMTVNPGLLSVLCSLLYFPSHPEYSYISFFLTSLGTIGGSPPSTPDPQSRLVGSQGMYTDTNRSASYLDLHLEIDSEGRLRTKLYDKDMMTIVPLWTFHLCVAQDFLNNFAHFSTNLAVALIKGGHSNTSSRHWLDNPRENYHVNDWMIGLTHIDTWHMIMSTPMKKSNLELIWNNSWW